MVNLVSLVGHTALITGASRGIGKQIALKLAQNGANIVVAAKTAEAHPKLPGTIHTTVEDIQKIGGKAIACVLDVRDEKSVEETVEEAVKQFGTLDILVNNASAISLTKTVDTQMKRYDLMHQINSRGTFLVSQKCIPYLQKGKNPHILNLSPPLMMETKWFANNLAYTMAKYGMSMCVLGMHEELRSLGIAVNALWPRTAVWTEALRMLYGDRIANECRKPQIVADAAFAILSRDSHKYTGNFAIDEDIMREEGCTDFDQYAVKPGSTLMPDFFLPAKYYQAEKPSVNDDDVDISKDLDTIKKMINKETVKAINAVYRFNLKKGETLTPIFINLKHGEGGVCKLDQGSNKNADVTLTLNARTFQQLFRGQLSPEVAFTSGRLRIEGDMTKVMLLSNFVKRK